MDIANFNMGVYEYLIFESFVVSKILSTNYYEAFIELGCDNIRFSDIAL